MQRKDTQNIYNLPTQVKYCKKCTVSNQRPRITFNEEGICSACTFNTYKRNIVDWDQRKNELSKLLENHRKSNGEFDVIVPCSGGKDGSYVAHKLKYEYGMNPLCVSFSPLKYTDIGRENLNSFINSGFDHILSTPNPVATRKLTELALKEMGEPFQPFVYGVSNFPLHISVKYKIPLIMYGENSEVEYGGDMKDAEKPDRDVNKHNLYFSNVMPSQWTKYGLSEKELNPFMPPKIEDIKKNKTIIHFYGHYEYWDPQENYYYAQKYCGFKPNEERSEGTYSKYASLDDKLDGFHYYLGFIKFGIGRATSDSAHEIRDGKIDREDGVELIKRYDGEFPKKHMNEFLEYVNISEADLTDIIDSWRSEHIWDKHSDGSWFLKNPIWEN